MPTFYVRSRKTGPITDDTVEADSREGAIAATVEAAGEGETVEVLQVQQAPADVEAPAPQRAK